MCMYVCVCGCRWVYLSICMHAFGPVVCDPEISASEDMCMCVFGCAHVQGYLFVTLFYYVRKYRFCGIIILSNKQKY